MSKNIRKNSISSNSSESITTIDSRSYSTDKSRSNSREFSIETNIENLYSSDLSISTKGTQRLVDICKEVGATEYISGLGGKTYLEEELFDCKITYFKPNIKNYYSVIYNI